MKINEKHLYFLLIVFILGIGTCNAQFFKYATFYSSGSVNTSMVENQDYIAINKGYEETTQINPYDYNFTIGIRKIARFNYEQKLTTWYYGNEKSVGDNTDKLLDLQKNLKHLEEETGKPIGNVTNNAVFVGSTTELQKLLKKGLLNNK